VLCIVVYIVLCIVVYIVLCMVLYIVLCIVLYIVLYIVLWKLVSYPAVVRQGVWIYELDMYVSMYVFVYVETNAEQQTDRQTPVFVVTKILNYCTTTRGAVDNSNFEHHYILLHRIVVVHLPGLTLRSQ